MYKSRKFFAFLLAFLMIANTLTPLAYAYTPPEEELRESILIPEEEYEEQEGPEETQNSTTVVIIEDGQPDENLESDTDVAPQSIGVVKKETPEFETTIEEKMTDTYVFNFYMSKEDVKDQSVKPFEIKEVEEGERLEEPTNQDVEAWLYLDEEGSEKELKFDNGKSEPISSLSANFNKNELDLFPKIKEEQEELEEVSLVAYSFHFVVLEDELDEIGEKGLAMIASLSLEYEEDEDAPSAKLPAEYIEVAEPTTGEVEDGGIVTAKPPELEDFELVEGQNLTFEVDALAENNFPIIYSARSNGMDVTEVDSSNTYVKTDFYKDSLFGIAGNFHLVGLTQIDNPKHTNGNLLTPRLIYGSNFGTNRLEIKEVSYAREIETSQSMTAGAQGNPHSYLVVGEKTKIETTDNGNSWSINGQKLNYPSKNSMPGHLWQDAESEFIDFEEVRREVLALSAKMASLQDSGVKINGSDMNNQSIEINDSSKDCYVYNFDANDFEQLTNPINVTGFNPDKPTTLTININMAGKTDFRIPASVAHYSNGSSVSTGEVKTWSNANVIWHFYDSSKSDNVYRGSINNEGGAVTGHIIAPGADVDLKNNINGTVIANKIVVNAESHRDDYTGPDCFGSEEPDPDPEVEKTDITAIKVWEGGPKPRPTVELQLYRDGEEYGSSVSLPNGRTSHTWENLEVTDSQGKKYVYYVKEVEVPDSYEQVESDSPLKVVNRYVIPKTYVEAEKLWVHGQNQWVKVWFKLYRETGVEGSTPEAIGDLKEVPLPKDGESSASVLWKDLDETDFNGNPYTFTVEEVDGDGEPITVENFDKSEEGLKVTNTYKIPLGPVRASKTWVDGEDAREPIKFKLYRSIAGGAEEAIGDIKTIEPEDNKDYQEVVWDDLEQTDIEGNYYSFRVEELNQDGESSGVKNFEKSEDGLDVTNTYEIPKTDVEAEKLWVDGQNQWVKVWFKLYRETGVEGSTPEAIGDLKEVPLPEDGESSASVLWEGLDATDLRGNPYTFTVEEVDGDGEPITVENFDKSEEGLKVTNTYKIPLGDLRAKKTWVNGKVVRENIWLKVYRVLGQLEEEVDTDLKEVEILDGQDTYEVEWKDLELTNSQGEYYDFVVREVDQNGENLDLESFEKFEDGREVINTYVIPKTDISAFKIWQDGPNTRPDIWFKLYRSLDLEDEGSWEALEGVDPVKLESGTKEVVFAGVEKTDKDGNPYYFKVVEVDGEGKDYTPDNYEKTEEGLRVTNKYIIPKGEIKALKTWFGEADKRPTIWFKLFRQIEGGQVEDVEADILELLDGVTEVAWQDMDLTDIDGNDYIYSVKEVDEDGDDYVPVYYVKEEKLLEVSNSLIEKGQLSLTKILEGRKLKDKEFTFNLMSEDMIVETVKNDGEGKISFEVLSFEEPGVYNYSIVEVKGKDSEISYDESVIKVSIKVDEKGQVEIVYSDEKGKVLEKPSFVNKYTPSKLPATGAAPMAGMLFGGLALLGGAFVLLRKKD